MSHALNPPAHLEVCVVDVFKDEAGCAGLGVPNNVQQLNDIVASGEIL